MKFKKVILSITLLISAVTILPLNVFAAGNQALLVGRDYGEGVNTTVDVANAQTGLGPFAYTYQTSTNPTISWMKGSNAGTKRMESDILFFSGHGNSDLMHFYDANHTTGYDFFITVGSNTNTNVGLSSYNMENVKLAVFAGCKTAEGSSNISKIAQSKGVKKTMGWTTSINAGAHTEWLKRFWSKAGKELYLSLAVNYADSFTYTDSRVKNHAQYGNWNLPIKTLSLTEYEVMVNGIKDNRAHEVNIAVNGLNEEEVISTVSDWIVNNIDENFKIGDYEIEKTVQENRYIYDIKLIINGDIKTKLGYTVFVTDNEITNIFNNMNNNSSDLKKQIACLSNNEIVSDYSNINDAISKANQKIDFENFEIVSQESYKYFDDDDRKIYQVIITELKNINDGTFYVDEFRLEIE